MANASFYGSTYFMQAWQSGQYDDDYDMWLVNKRRESIPIAFSRVSDFKFIRKLKLGEEHDDD